MEFSHIISFICGGLISAIIFYPRYNMKNKIDYLARLLSYQYYYGVRTRQDNIEMPDIRNEIHLNEIARTNSWIYNQSAEKIINELEKL